MVEVLITINTQASPEHIKQQTEKRKLIRARQGCCQLPMIIFSGVVRNRFVHNCAVMHF